MISVHNLEKPGLKQYFTNSSKDGGSSKGCNSLIAVTKDG
jgi:hypothetical protein